jgi:hypothetical protein
LQRKKGKGKRKEQRKEGEKESKQKRKSGFSFCGHTAKKPDEKVGRKRPKVQFCFVV